MFPPRLSRSTTTSSAAVSGYATPIAHTGSQAGDMSPVPSMHVKKVTLTSKKNWWLVELDEDEEEKPSATANSFSSEETAVAHHAHHETHAVISQPFADVDPGSRSPTPSPNTSPHIFQVPDRHPSAIFSFPTPTTYAAPPNATAHLAPFATGSTSELFKCIVKKPEVVSIEINGEMQTNAADVTTQFLAELRVYTTVSRHRNIVGFLGCLEGIGMVLEFVDGRTLLEVVRSRPPLEKNRKIDIHNQLLDGLAHLHSFGLSHGDLSLLNVYVTRTDTVKLLDFGRSVAADSYFRAPHAEPEDPFASLVRSKNGIHMNGLKKHRIEQIHVGTRPFTAPEILRGECVDARLADAYSFGVILACIDHDALVDCDPEVQRRDIIPKHFVEGSHQFRERVEAYLQPRDRRRRIVKEDRIAVKMWWDD